MLNKIEKNTLDKYFIELSKIYKKLTHGYEIEIILIGGASILINYNFRDVTNDIDALYLPSSEIKEAIKEVSKKFNISTKWLKMISKLLNLIVLNFQNILSFINLTMKS